jgi:superfamily I DNA and RNA helicase
MSYSGIVQVSPWDVKVPDEQARVDVERQKRRLEEEGQIEPVVVRRATNEPDPAEWVYAAAQVVAARELDWPDILVVYSR